MSRKICFVAHAHFPQHSPRKLRQTSSALAAGFEVDLLCLRHDGQPLRECCEGVNVYRLPLRKKRGSPLRYLFEYAAAFVGFFFLTAYLHGRKRYDLVHVYSLPDFMVFAALIPKWRGAKIILDNLDPMPEMYAAKYHRSMDALLIRVLKKIERVSAAFAHVIVTQNHVYAEVLESRGKYRERIIPILNPPDVRYFGALATPADHSGTAETVLLFHGTISARYGLDIALRALPLILAHQPSVRFVIAGSGDYLEGILELIAALNISEHVTFLGEKKVAEIPQIIRACTFGIIPPRATVYNDINVPNRVFEYLWLGKPVIAARTRALQHYFSEDMLVYFTPGDVDDFAAKVRWAITYPEAAAASARKAQEVCLRYSWENQKAVYLKMLRSPIAHEVAVPANESLVLEK